MNGGVSKMFLVSLPFVRMLVVINYIFDAIIKRVIGQCNRDTVVATCVVG